MKSIPATLKNDKGQSTVEFALVAILLLILVFGIIEFGWAWYRADILKNAANIGARTCAVKKNIGDARTAAEMAIPKYDPAKTTITVPDCATAAPMSQVTVTISEPLNAAVPGLLPMLGGITIRRTATYSMEP